MPLEDSSYKLRQYRRQRPKPARKKKRPRPKPPPVAVAPKKTTPKKTAPTFFEATTGTRIPTRKQETQARTLGRKRQAFARRVLTPKKGEGKGPSQKDLTPSQREQAKRLGITFSEPKRKASLAANLWGVDVPGVPDPQRTLGGAFRQAREIPAAIGPGIAAGGEALGKATAAKVTFGKYGSTKKLDELLASTSKDLKYLATPGPVIVGYEKGRTVYRAKDGGKTYDRSEAKTGITAKAEERPLDYLLIGRGALLGTGRAVARIGTKAGKDWERPGTRELKTRAGTPVRQPTSPNPVRRGEQHATRAISTGATGAVERAIGRELPVVGEHARAVRLASKRQRRSERADIGRATQPFERDFRKLNAKEAVAVVLHAQGLRPSELRSQIVRPQRELAKRKAREAHARGDRAAARRYAGEARDHSRMLKTLSRVDDGLYDAVEKVPKLQQARAAAATLSEQTGDILTAVEKLSPESRALRPYLPVRVARGARFQETSARKGRAEQVRDYPGRSKTVTRPRTRAEAETRLAELNQRFDDYADTLARGHELRRSQSERNMKAGKRRKASKGAPVLEQAKQEAMLQAEQAAHRSDHPSAKRFLAELEERDTLERTLGGGELLDEAAPTSFGKLTETIPGKPRRVHLREIAAQKRGGEFVGGPEIEGLKREFPNLLQFSHTGKKLREGQQVQKGSGAVSPRAPGITKQNKAVRLLASRWIPHPSVWRDSYVQAIGYMHAKARGELAFGASRPLNSDGSKNPGWYYVRLDEGTPPKGKRRPKAGPSRAARERGDLDREMDEFIAGEGDMEGWLRERVASREERDVARWLEENPQAKVAQISPADYREIFGEFKPANRFLKRFVDDPTTVWRTLTLTYRPAWVVNNFVGQTLLYAVNNFGPGGAAAYAQAILDEARKGEGKYFPEELRMGGFVRSEATSGGMSSSVGKARMTPGSRRIWAPLQAGRAVEATMRDKISRFNAALSDNVPRRAAWYQSVEKRRRLLNRLDRVDRTNTTFAHFLDELEDAAKDPAKGDKRLRDVHDELVQEVLDQLIDFQNLSHLERTVVRRAVPFYSWIKGMTQATFRLGWEHPLKAEILALLGEQGQSLSEREYGKGSSILRSTFPLGAEKDRGRGPERDVLSTVGLNPYQTPSDVAGFVRGTVSGDLREAAENPALALHPLIQAGIETATGNDLFTRKELTGLPVPGLRGRVGIAAKQLGRSFPQVSTAERAFNPPEPTSASGKPRVTVPGAKVAGVPTELVRYAGVPVKRVNVDAAEAIAERKRLEDLAPGERAYHRVFQERAAFTAAAGRLGGLENGRLPEVTRRAFNRKAEVQAARVLVEHGTAPNTIERETGKLLAELALLREWGYAGPRDVERVERWVATASLQDVEDTRIGFREHFDDAYLADLRADRETLNEAGANLP